MCLLRQIEGGAEEIGGGGGSACIPSVHRSLDECSQIMGEELLARLEQTSSVSQGVCVATPRQRNADQRPERLPVERVGRPIQTRQRRLPSPSTRGGER